MSCSIEELEAREHENLAAYAQLSCESRGRRFKEVSPEWRTQFQRDRDRVIHSRAFRRLEYKTQVFLNGAGDHLRTRLTHTMEVASIARNIARALRVNEDLTEAIALSHDLGHAPFGHAGEEALDKLMCDHGGFEHNRQSRRVVEELEQKYPGFPGLNLTWETREGLAKHETAHDQPTGQAEFKSSNPSLEAQVANLADEISYYSHDLDDGLDSGLLDEADLAENIGLWHEASAKIMAEYGVLNRECRHYFIIRCLIDDQVRDVIHTTESRIREVVVSSADAVRAEEKPLVSYSTERRKSNLQLRQYLYQNLYYNDSVHEPHVRAMRMLEELFEFFMTHPEEMGAQARARIGANGMHRAVCDYMAGMTDRYAICEHGRLVGG